MRETRLARIGDEDAARRKWEVREVHIERARMPHRGEGQRGRQRLRVVVERMGLGGQVCDLTTWRKTIAYIYVGRA